MRRPQFRSAELRRALNAAVDRGEVVSEGLSNHGTVADGPVWPDHWAYDAKVPRFNFDPANAAAVIRRLNGAKPLHFVCLAPAAQPYEHLGLVVQRQLRAVGVDMMFEPLSYEQMTARIPQGDFQAALIDAHIAATLFHAYEWWYSKGPGNASGYQSAAVDAALEAISRAPNDEAYRRGVADFGKAITDDPPAIFLAWSERARAVSTRFQVPSEGDRDIFGSIRLFKPAADERTASRN